MATKGVILCGGLATRMLPISKSVPKEMMPLLNRPAIDYCVNDLKSNGISDILIVLGRGKEILENYFDKNVEIEDRLKDLGKETLLAEQQSIYQGVNISFVRQIDAKGTGFAVSKAENFVGSDSFVLMFPDEILLGESFTKQLLDCHKKSGSCVLPIKKIDRNLCNRYGMISFKRNSNNVGSIVEKPSLKDCPSDYCYTGGGFFDSSIFEYLKKCPVHENGEIYLTDAFEPLCNQNKLVGAEISGTRLDLGTPLGLIEGNILAGLKDDTISSDLKEFILNLAKKLD